MLAGLAVTAIEDADVTAVVTLWERCGLTRPWNDPVADIALARQLLGYRRQSTEPATRAPHRLGEAAAEEPELAHLPVQLTGEFPRVLQRTEAWAHVPETPLADQLADPVDAGARRIGRPSSSRTRPATMMRSPIAWRPPWQIVRSARAG